MLSSRCCNNLVISVFHYFKVASTMVEFEESSSSKKCSREVLLDEEDRELLTSMLIGSIEVECLRSDDGAHITDRILLLPPSGEGLQIRLKNTESLLDNDDESICNPEEEEELLQEEEGVEVDAGFLEQLAVAILEGCHCGPCAPYKSALRTGKKHEHSSTDRGVSFSCLQIREFNMTLGDHPSAVSGPPVALDWDSQAEERTVNLDEYERTRNPRRKRRQLKLSYKDRKKILEKQRGFTTDEVNQAWSEALKIRQQRKETLQRGTLLMMWDEFSESTLRKYNRMLTFVGF